MDLKNIDHYKKTDKRVEVHEIKNNDIKYLGERVVYDNPYRKKYFIMRNKKLVPLRMLKIGNGKKIFVIVKN